MKIAVLCGSPKGENSITLQYVRYLSGRLQGHDFPVFHVARDIKKLENDPRAFDAVLRGVEEADGVLWAFGLWVLAVSAQYMRFMEMIDERGAARAFQGKYAAALSTSIHYFDHTAHNFVRGVCDDLGMRFVDALSMDIQDLREPKARRQLEFFGENVIAGIRENIPTTRRFAPLRFSAFTYRPGPPPEGPVDTRGKKVLVLTDRHDPDTNLGKMVDRFRRCFDGEADLVDLRDVDIKGACRGCMRCGYDFTCVYKDGFAGFYEDRVMTADCIVFAGEMRGRYLSSLWKTFYDRAFFRNHTPSLPGKQLAYIVSGPLSQNANLQELLEASSTARQKANHVGVVTDECGDSARIDGLLQDLAGRMICYAEQGYLRPQTFLGVGGHKIFRDNIWGRLRMVWQADHRHYKKNGFYDFPQKAYAMRLLTALVMLMTKIPRVRRRFYENMLKGPKRQMGKIK